MDTMYFRREWDLYVEWFRGVGCRGLEFRRDGISNTGLGIINT